jgi:hypothetical protein
MKVQTVWTPNEGDNVLRTLKSIYGDKQPSTLLKYAVRDFLEHRRVTAMHRKSQIKFGLNWRAI